MAEPQRPHSGGEYTELGETGELAPTLSRAYAGNAPARSKTEADISFGPPEKPGEVGKIGRYRVLKKLGQGGMGAVYLGYDVVLNRRVALKVLLPQRADAESRARFLREARAAAALRSDHVVTIYDVGEELGLPFIAMEYLLGYSLDQFLRVNGELPTPQVFRVGREVALGLSAAHEQGLVHRDVKPGNTWLEAPHGRVKLLDFGLARAQDDKTQLTTSGLVVGTPAFMSPEQARGHDLDGRSDLFSLGVMLYRLATGEMPFSGGTTMAVLTSLAVDVPAPARQRKPDVPAALEAVIAKLLAKNPADRYQTALEVAEALRAAERGAGELPVVVQAVPMAIAAQSDNVWEGIEESVSSPQLVKTGTDAVPSLTPPSVRRKSEGKSPVLPLAVAALAFVAAVGILAAVLVSVKKDKEPVALKDEPKGPSIPPPPPPPKPPDRKAAEYALALGGAVEVNSDKRAIKVAADLPRTGFALTSVHLDQKNPNDEGMANFKGCKDVLVINLQHSSVGDAGVGNLRDSTRLRQIWLNNTRLTDAGMTIVKNWPELILIDLSGTQVGDAGLANLKDCKSLTILALINTKVTDAGLSHLKDCKSLVALHLDGTQVTSAGLENFRGCEGLTDLTLGECKAVGDEGLKALRDSKNMAGLILTNTAVGDAGLEAVGEFKRLGHLDLRGTQVSDAGLVHLRDCKALGALVLQRTKVTGAGVAALAKSLPNCKIDWDGGTIGPSDPDRKAAEYAVSLGAVVGANGDSRAIKELGDVPRAPFALTAVHLAEKNPPPTDEGMANFRGCKDILLINLYKSPVGDAGLMNLRDCTKLKQVWLSSTKVTGAGLAIFEKCADLGFLDLGDTRVDDAGLAHLKGCRQLAHLSLHSTAVTDAGVAHLANLSNLSILRLTNTPITDAGLAPLKSCERLVSLDVKGTKVTAKGVAEFAKALPKCKIEWDGGVIEPSK